MSKKTKKICIIAGIVTVVASIAATATALVHKYIVAE